ncbi:MAG: hypothetical protein JKY53_06665 [Flavobacteriales bacterium]|nr:hypothetical protein [Flavobacteriales bacterium]
MKKILSDFLFLLFGSNESNPEVHTTKELLTYYGLLIPLLSFLIYLGTIGAFG